MGSILRILSSSGGCVANKPENPDNLLCPN
ncbi:hypothetical protein D047_4491A, partial [Vibrio parahaemolyticus VPTS-2010_2]